MSLRAFGQKRIALVIGLALWIPSVAAGLSILWSYSTTPGRAAEPPRHQPSATRAHLLMFVHPRCPCSDASMGELAKLMASAGPRLEASVYFFYPRQQSASWAHTGLWNSAAAIPGVRAIEDRDAEMAGRFGAFTSGQTLVYDASGNLRFKGGITAARGHSGDNAGRSAVEALLASPDSVQELVSTPVFGCSLTGE